MTVFFLHFSAAILRITRYFVFFLSLSLFVICQFLFIYFLVASFDGLRQARMQKGGYGGCNPP